MRTPIASKTNKKAAESFFGKKASADSNLSMKEFLKKKKVDKVSLKEKAMNMLKRGMSGAKK